MSFLATALGQDPTRIEQAPFTENRLQQIQRQNQDRLNRNEFLRGTKDAQKAINAGLAISPALTNPDLQKYFSDQRFIAPEIKTPEVKTTELPPLEEPKKKPEVNVDDGGLTLPNFVPEESGLDAIGKSGAPDITQIDPQSSAFMQDIQGILARGDFASALMKIGDRAATGYGEALAGSPAGNIYGYFFDNPDQAKLRADATAATKWYRSQEARNYFAQNPNQLQWAAVDPVGWYETFKKEASLRKRQTTIKSSSSRADNLVTRLTTDLDNKLNNRAVRDIRDLARVVGFDPNFAVAILGIESAFGANVKTSGKGAKGAMQIIEGTFNQMKQWYTNPNNIRKYNISDSVVGIARQLDYSKQNHQMFAGLLYLKYGEYIGVPKNLLAAGYQGGMESVKKLGSATQANDGSLTNNDYNRVVISVYNQILANSNRTAGLNVGGTNQTTAQTTGDVSTDTSAPSSNTGNVGTSSTDVSSLEVVTPGLDKKQKPSTDTTVVKELEEPAFFMSEPSNIGFELRQATETRQMLIDQANNRLRQMSGLANVSLLAGNNDEYMSLNNQMLTLKEATEREAKKAEANILYLQGMQGLQDLAMGSTARAAFVWSQVSGFDVRIIPRTDGKYDVTLNGQPYKTYTAQGLGDTLRRSFDENYRQLIAQTQAARSLATFESQLKIHEKRIEQEGQAYLKRIEGIQKLEEKRAGTTAQEMNGLPVVIRDGVVHAIEINEVDVGGQKQLTYTLVPIEAQTANTNPYKRSP